MPIHNTKLMEARATAMHEYNDAQARLDALDPTRSFIVQAPAGSGKTELLTQRYLVLLSHAQKAPEEIIAITFTRKAAAEMRARVISALSFAQTAEPGKNDYRHKTWQLAHKVLQKDKLLEWELIKNPNRLRILTIDALSAFLCRQTPMLTHFGGTPAVCENATAFYQLAAQRLLLHISTTSEWQPQLEHLLLHCDNQVEKCEHLFADLLNHRDQWLPHIVRCYSSSHNLRDIFENSLQQIVKEKLHHAARVMPPPIKQTLMMLTQHVGDYFAEKDPDHLLAHCAHFNFGLDVSNYYSWFAVANLLLTQDHTWRKTIDIRSGFAPKEENKSLMLALLTELQAHDAFKESLKDILQLPPVVYTSLQWETLTALIQLLPLLAAQLTLVFQEKGEIDFIELNLAALKALGSDESPTDLALYLDYQIHHLLIDEFQDTSVVHLHLLEKITAGWQPDDGRTLFVVGDPMQSIYRFRNAEVGLFLRAQQRGIRDITLHPLTLTMNFRSTKNMVSWFNDSFTTIFPAVSDIATGRVTYTPALAASAIPMEARARATATPELIAVNNNVQFYPVIADNNYSEAKLIAEKIHSCRENHPNDTIAILVRSRSQLTPILPLLKEASIPFQAIDIEPLADRPEIRDCISLTRALLHRADRIAWFALLRAPFCGCTLADMEIIARASHQKTLWETLLSPNLLLSSDGMIRINKLRNVIQHAFNTQYQLPFAQWVEHTWIHLRGPACLTDETELNYTRAYFNLLLKIDNNAEPFSIDKIMDACERLFANSEACDPHAIQIMTIHKSKGLEFDHVFLPGLQRQTPADKTKLFRWLDRPNAYGGNELILAPMKSITEQSDPIYDYLNYVEQQKQDHEITRLLYVATTRAKKGLYLFATLAWDEKKSAVKPPKKGSFLEKLWPIYETTIASLSPPQSALQNTVNSSPLLFSRLRSDYESPATPMEARAQATANPTQSADCESSAILMEARLPATANPINIDIQLHPQKSRVTGSVLHEIFLLAAMEARATAIPAWIGATQWESRLQSLGILPHEIAECSEIIHKALINTQSDTRGRWIFSPAHQHAKSEYALSLVHNNETQHVIIDRTFVDENNHRWIIDYKTSSPKENETLEDFLQREKHHYQSQLERYAIIFTPENRPIYLGLYFPLCSGWIEWEYTLMEVSV